MSGGPLLWVDPSAGVAGDMLLGALLDAGAPLDPVRAAVRAVAGDAVSLDPQPVTRAGLRALHVRVGTADDAPHRTWRDVQALLTHADLDSTVRDAALRVFGALADAEGRVHGHDPEEVHFHEVGALDALADIVGSCAALHALGVSEVVAGPVSVGSGTVATAHGLLPVPAPAVVELLRGAPTQAGPSREGSTELGELATPTGASLLATLVARWGGQPPMRVRAQGLGAGTRQTLGRPNVVRVLLGEPLGTAAPDEAAPADALVLEANVDDMDPRLWPSVLSSLLAAGASDAWLTPILMKKGRPAHMLSVLVGVADLDAVRRTVFKETSTIGLRESRVAKHALTRSGAAVDVDGQRVRVKLAVLDGEVVNAQPEWEDVAAAAHALERPAKAVLAAAVAAAHRLPAG